jgi:hypothetical protein
VIFRNFFDFTEFFQDTDKYGLTIPASSRIITLSDSRRLEKRVYGVAVDLAFLTEMSNLSPPIIRPPSLPLDERPAARAVGRSLF